MTFKTLSDAGLPPDGALFWIFVMLSFGVAALAWRTTRQSKQVLRYRNELERERIARTTAETRASDVDGLKDALAEERAGRQHLETQKSADEARLAEREKSLAELKARMDTDFKASAALMLEDAQKSFLARANQTFEHHNKTANTEAERRRKAMDDMMRPMGETLQRYEKGLTEMRAEQHKQRGEFSARIGDLAKSANEVRLEANKLSTALRAGSKIRGRWGEEQLRNVVEIAGMASYVDFIEQHSIATDDRRKQPDMLVNLPGGRKIAVDSKVSINAYLDAVEAESETLRATHLTRHASDLWTHVKALSAKDYAADIRDSLDIVIMFIPGENYFAAAMETRPQLFQDAFDRKILIATPTTLVAMLKAASFNWRQERAAENAQEVAGMAKDLYDSLRTMGGHFASMGKALGNAVKKYNDAVGGLEGRVMPKARRFAEYELPGIEVDLVNLTEIDEAPRQLRSDRDLLLEDQAEETDAPERGAA